MSTRGFENFTEADAARFNALRPASNVKVAENQPKNAVKAPKRSKYLAEPCIVTSDLTLFVTKDIEALEAQPNSWIGHDPDGKWKKSAPLRERANSVGVIGEWFGSLKEGRRYIELKRLEAAGEVRGLTCQVSMPLTVGARQHAIGCYVADFVYERQVGLSAPTWTHIVEDVKGVKTPLYRWKKKHVEAQYSIIVSEV